MMECGAYSFPGGDRGVHQYDSHGALAVTGEGCPVASLHTPLTKNVHPSLIWLFTAAELKFDGVPYTQWALARWQDGSIFLLCASYLALAFGVQLGLRRYTSVRFDLRRELAAWNLGLAVFSAVGAMHLLPHLAYLISQRGYYSSVCSPAEPAFGSGSAGLWTMAFIMSKVPELLDTAFIVLRRKQLLFLHWYHHVTVLMYCWHSYGTRASPGLYFAAINYAVHAVMYYYYYLQAVGARPKWGKYVTTIQISQMFIGMGVVGSAIVYKWGPSHSACDVTDENLVAALAMYASYAALFIWFAVNRYITPDSDAKGRSRSGVGSQVVKDE